MSKVKIQGNASGTGVLTITAPNTSTDRVITLPDSTGTLLTSDGDGSSLTGVGVDGISSSADATAITIDSSENVGIGVTPKTWDSRKALQIGGNGALAGSSSAGAGGYLQLLQNAFTDGTWKYISTDEAARLRSQDGQWNFDVAASGSADSAITWSNAMTIDNSGQVTMPLQPAFMWKGVATNFTPDTSTTLFVFDSEVFDIGNNAVNNRFTAPVAGVYHFDVFLQHAGPGANTETRYMQVGFRKNTTTLDEHSSLQAMEAVADGWGSGNSYHPQQISTNIQLSANDYVDITVSRSSSSDWNGTFNSDRTRWSGYLIG